ncbi:GWxTD domain-containing protein [Rhodohalobacter sp. 614A]|uniref:GWxTD domain-containing protein n=1 Tax=Rhodohalobacter sp. 614A TaxID=2908649 RepID=UPI001F197623|nr:GWxTD domain-containing protein [Rhodohalobacter sp. 614A]
MSRYKNFIAAQFFLFCFLLNTLTVFGQAQQAYERGMEEISRGNISQALDIWYNSYKQSDRVDSRIGFEFIRVVAENQMRSYYDPATNLYYQALTNGVGMNSRIAIRQEIERLKPIIGDGIFRQWMNWWDERDSSLPSDMKGFWVQNDPTPANATNERLIEHWQRIATAKEQFTKNESTVYGTDARSLIYVRYGEADRVKSGILTLQSFNIRQWLENQLLPEFNEGDDPMPETVRSNEREFMNRLENAIYEYHRYPEYEIWFYDQIVEPQEAPIIFVFGTDVRNDQFTLQTSLEDFIPERAFYAEENQDDESLEFTRVGITPALILQLLYYEQLAQVDPFFGSRLNELQTRILDQGIQAFQGMDLAFQSESKEIIHEQVMQAPQQESTYAELIPKIPLEVYHYRLLGDSLQPEILTYVESSAHEAFLIDYNRNQGTNLLLKEEIDEEYDVLDEYTFYELTHTLLSYDESWEKTLSRSDQPPLYITRPSAKRMSTTLFRQPHTGKTFQAVSVELMNYDPDSKSIYHTPFPPALRGWNKEQYRQPEPLVSHPDSMEVSDLILGYNHTNEITEPFDFKVANNRLIPFGETLLLHFEVYNLAIQADGFSRFEMTYRILPVDEQGNVNTDQTEFILTLNFTNEESVVDEDLEIETTDLNPGLYELVVSILDTESDQTRERKIRFEVVE